MTVLESQLIDICIELMTTKSYREVCSAQGKMIAKKDCDDKIEILEKKLLEKTAEVIMERNNGGN